MMLVDYGSSLVRPASITITALFVEALDGIRPWALIDARMRKHARPEASRGLAPVTIGIGPGFAAGHTVDLVIESAWGEPSDR